MQATFAEEVINERAYMLLKLSDLTVSAAAESIPRNVSYNGYWLKKACTSFLTSGMDWFGSTAWRRVFDLNISANRYKLASWNHKKHEYTVLLGPPSRCTLTELQQSKE